jgi:hypothetical protein
LHGCIRATRDTRLAGILFTWQSQKTSWLLSDPVSTIKEAISPRKTVKRAVNP